MENNSIEFRTKKIIEYCRRFKNRDVDPEFSALCAVWSLFSCFDKELASSIRCFIDEIPLDQAIKDLQKWPQSEH